MNMIAEVRGASLADRARGVAKIAAKFADTVDHEGRFPHETVAAMKEARLFGAQVPVEFGGESASISDIAEACCILGQECASSAMIFAMHHIKLSSLVSHGAGDVWHEAFMRRVAAEQLLLGSATTEAGIGGNLRNSICAIEVEGDTCRLTKDATVISYGEYADAILITSRAHKDAAPSDQVMTVFLKGQYTLDKTHVWDTLGMRGTCSDGFLFKAQAPKVQILPKPFAEIAAESMLADLPSSVEWRLVRHCGQRRCARPEFRACGRARQSGLDAARRAASGGSLCRAATDQVQRDCRLSSASKKPSLILPSCHVDGLCRCHEQRQGRHLAEDPDDHQSCDDDLRHRRLQERHALQRRSPPARCAFGAADDFERPHSRQHVEHAAHPQTRHKPFGIIAMDMQVSFLDRLFECRSSDRHRR